MAYATVNDVQARMTQTMTESQRQVCTTLLEDVAVLIDAYNVSASEDAKKIVSCMSVARAMGDTQGVPVGATTGSMSAMGYSQSWTLSNGSTGEIYLSKTEKKLLGVGNSIGSRSPVEDLVVTSTEW